MSELYILMDIGVYNTEWWYWPNYKVVEVQNRVWGY